MFFFFFFVSYVFSPWYVCLLAKLACQVKFKQILLEQLWLFMGKWLDPLTVSILNFYAFIFMTVILMKKHFKPPLKWRKYHSSTLTHRPRHRPRPSPSPRPELKLKLKLKLNLSAKLKSSQVKSRLMLIRSFFFFFIHICVLWVFICMRTYLGFKITDRFVLTFTHFSSAAYDGICRFYVVRQTLRRIRRRLNLIVVNCKLEMYLICIE